MQKPDNHFTLFLPDYGQFLSPESSCPADSDTREGDPADSDTRTVDPALSLTLRACQYRDNERAWREAQAEREAGDDDNILRLQQGLTWRDVIPTAVGLGFLTLGMWALDVMIAAAFGGGQ